MVSVKDVSRLYARRIHKRPFRPYSAHRPTDKGLQSGKSLRNIESGNKRLRWGPALRIYMRTESAAEISDKLLEKARVSLVRRITKLVNKDSYLLRFPQVPHNYLRYHALATGSDAGRISKGMKLAFGTPFMLSARVRRGQPLVEIYVAQNTAKDIVQSLKKILHKIGPCLPLRCKIVLEKNKLPKKITST